MAANSGSNSNEAISALRLPGTDDEYIRPYNEGTDKIVRWLP